MKSDIHPTSRLVAFKDMQNGTIKLFYSTLETKTTEVIDGVEYPLMRCDITSSTHPFYTGSQNLVTTSGQIDKFKAKMAKAGR